MCRVSKQNSSVSPVQVTLTFLIILVLATTMTVSSATHFGVRRIPTCFCRAFDICQRSKQKNGSQSYSTSISKKFSRHSQQFANSAKMISTGRFLSATTSAPPSTSSHVIQEAPLDPAIPENQISKAARENLSILDTNLGGNADYHSPETGHGLLDGLDVFSVPALGDHHPLAVYRLKGLDYDAAQKEGKHPILLLHGRTWSSVPVYHLLGGDVSKNPLIKTDHDDNDDDTHQSRSLMEALVDTGLAPYTMDFRGFGGTPKDETGYVEPYRCVRDVETVLLWMAQRQCGRHLQVDSTTNNVVAKLKNITNVSESGNLEMPALLGWSQGALVAQLAAQAHPDIISRLILYASIYDPLVRYPREPLYRINEKNASKILNSFNDAIEDFTVQGTIPPEPARLFAEAALVSDPIKAVWKHLYQFNNCDPARVHIPTLVVAGDQDPYAPLHVQQELFCQLGRGSDRTWSILANADHAAHLLNDARYRFIDITTSFVNNGKRAE